MTVQTVRIKQVDAFTRKPFSGNPAGVVIHAEQLRTEDMQNIAREMNLSETVFVLPPEDEENDLRLRWFTPKQEVDLCGHATIAAFHALAEEGEFGLEVNEPQSFLIETRSGNLTVDLEWKDFLPYVKFSLPIPRFFPFPDDLGVLCGALGISKVELSQKVSPQITDNGYCFVPLKDFDSLATLEPNQHLLKKLDERHDLKGFAVVTTDTGDDDTDWHMRFFAPELGVFEDPVTGSANGPMAAFLYYNGFLEEDKKWFTFKATQGHFIKRSGTVYVNMTVQNGEINELQIAGQAITVMEGVITLNPHIPEKF